MHWTKVAFVGAVLCFFIFLYVTVVSRNQRSPSCSSPEVFAKELSEKTHVHRIPHTSSCNCSHPPPSPSTSLTTQPPTTDQQRSLPQLLQNFAYRVFFPRNVNRETEKYTLVIQTYKRVKVLVKLLNHYCGLQRVEKILVLWNDVGTSVPAILRDMRCALPLVIIEEKQNRMTNRFKPRPEITTEAVMIIDDDRWIELDDMLLLFLTWQDFRQRIVGFEHRMHSRNPNGKYHYGPGWNWGDTPEKLGYSMMITPQCIFHKVYLELFNLPQFTPTEVLQYIDREMNCDDIAINFVVSKFLEQVSWPQTSGLTVANKHPIKNLAGQSGGYIGLSNSRQAKHYNTRSECLNLMAKQFNGFPLHYTRIGAIEKY